MVAALNVYHRQVVNGRTAPSNTAQRRQAQNNQPRNRQMTAQGGQVQQQGMQQHPQQQMHPQQAQQHQAAFNGYAYMPQGMQQQQQAPMTPHQQRQAHRQAYHESALRAQGAQQGMQQHPQASQFYGQWQQQGMQHQGGVYAPPQQQIINPNEAPALQQARMNGLDQNVPAYARPIQHFASQADEMSFQADGQFNPYAYGGEGWRNGLQQAMPDPRNRMFNAQGQLNAQDNRDALRQTAHLLRNASSMARTAMFNRQASQMMTEERRQVLAAAVQDPEGFAIMGQELLLPIKDLVDYEGWSRKVYRVRPLAQGELFRIAKDVRSTAWIIGQDGQGIEARLYGEYVTPSEFKIGSFPTVDIHEIYQMNYDVLDRAQSTARQEIELEEDKRARALIDNAANTVNTVTAFSTLGVGPFEDVRFQVERHRLVVDKFLINRAELSDVIKTMSSQVDPVTERELILAGYIGSFMNAVILTSAGTGVQEVVPAGTFYAVTAPEYMGEMGIRVELFSEPFNMFSQMRFVKGWAFGEIIGFVIANPYSCAKGVKS